MSYLAYFVNPDGLPLEIPFDAESKPEAEEKAIQYAEQKDLEFTCIEEV